MTASTIADDRSGVAGDVEPVMMMVVKNGLDSIAEQMAITLRRTAHSTVIREILDFGVGLFDRKGQLLSQTTGAPIFINAMGPTLRFILENAYPLEAWENGDVILVNDPYLGGSQHLPDIAAFRPIFHGDDLVGITASIAHHVDVGGTAPGSYHMSATEIFQEGLRIPPVKLYRRGELVADIKSMLTANIRLPDAVWGDLEAQVACMKIGERGLLELYERHGRKTVEDCGAALLDYSERLMRQGIRKIPDGRYSFEDRLDDDGVRDEPVAIKVTLTVEGDEIIADFSGSAPQRAAPINCSESQMHAVVHYAVTATVAADMPVNEGCFRSIHLIAPRGSVVNATPPAPVVGRMATVHRACDVVFGALAQAVPDRVPAAFYGMSTTTVINGLNDDDSLSWVLFQIDIGGWGGRTDDDGLSATAAHCHNVGNTPIEMIERLRPVRVERYALRPDSGGAGAQRGGLGIIRDLRLLEGRTLLATLADRMKFRPYGLAEGGEGAATELILNPETAQERRLPSKCSGVRFQAGDLLSIRTSGGGGNGRSELRDQSAIQRDLDLGYITAPAARRDYGFTLETGEESERSDR